MRKRRRINVRKHKRRLKSGNATIVRKHWRRNRRLMRPIEVDAINLRLTPPSELEKEIYNLEDRIESLRETVISRIKFYDGVIPEGFRISIDNELYNIKIQLNLIKSSEHEKKIQQLLDELKNIEDIQKKNTEFEFYSDYQNLNASGKTSISNLMKKLKLGLDSISEVSQFSEEEFYVTFESDEPYSDDKFIIKKGKENAINNLKDTILNSDSAYWEDYIDLNKLNKSLNWDVLDINDLHEQFENRIFETTFNEAFKGFVDIDQLIEKEIHREKPIDYMVSYWIVELPGDYYAVQHEIILQ